MSLFICLFCFLIPANEPMFKQKGVLIFSTAGLVTSHRQVNLLST